MNNLLSSIYFRAVLLVFGISGIALAFQNCGQGFSAAGMSNLASLGDANNVASVNLAAIIATSANEPAQNILSAPQANVTYSNSATVFESVVLRAANIDRVIWVKSSTGAVVSNQSDLNALVVDANAAGEYYVIGYRGQATYIISKFNLAVGGAPASGTQNVSFTSSLVDSANGKDRFLVNLVLPSGASFKSLAVRNGDTGALVSSGARTFVTTKNSTDSLKLMLVAQTAAGTESVFTNTIASTSNTCTANQAFIGGQCVNVICSTRKETPLSDGSGTIYNDCVDFGTRYGADQVICKFASMTFDSKYTVCKCATGSSFFNNSCLPQMCEMTTQAPIQVNSATVGTTYYDCLDNKTRIARRIECNSGFIVQGDTCVASNVNLCSADRRTEFTGGYFVEVCNPQTGYGPRTAVCTIAKAVYNTTSNSCICPSGTAYGTPTGSTTGAGCFDVVCTQDTQATVANGTGIRRCLNNGLELGPIEVTSCAAGYMNSKNQCVQQPVQPQVQCYSADENRNLNVGESYSVVKVITLSHPTYGIRNFNMNSLRTCQSTGLIDKAVTSPLDTIWYQAPMAGKSCQFVKDSGEVVAISADTKFAYVDRQGGNWNVTCCDAYSTCRTPRAGPGNCVYSSLNVLYRLLVNGATASEPDGVGGVRHYTCSNGSVVETYTPPPQPPGCTFETYRWSPTSFDGTGEYVAELVTLPHGGAGRFALKEIVMGSGEWGQPVEVTIYYQYDVYCQSGSLTKTKVIEQNPGGV